MRMPGARAARRAALRQLIERRDAICRRLDAVEFMAFMREIGRWDKPVSPSVPYAAMHKCRLFIEGVSDAEREQSRQWLRANGYTESL